MRLGLGLGLGLLILYASTSNLAEVLVELGLPLLTNYLLTTY